jgi:peptidyl-prolyl cis-trans isomerase SurA
MRFSMSVRAAFLIVALSLLSLGGGIHEARSQNIIVLVNDEPITSFDVAQRQRWMARTNGSYGERMKAALTGDSVQQRFRQAMIAANPRSEAEAKEAAERIKKQLVEDAKHSVLAGGADKKAAIDALVEDKLKLQAAKKLDIKITDKEVEETLAQRAGISADQPAPAPAATDAPAATSPNGSAEGKGRHRKGRSGDGKGETASTGSTASSTGGGSKNPKLDEFFQQFENDGINRRTIKEIIRAQLAWRDVIRRLYGARISSLISSVPNIEQKPSEGEIQYDVRILRLAIAASSDQKAVSQRILQAENLKEKFTSCANLPKEAQLVSDATVRTIEKARLTSFPKDIQPLLEKASEGQMTPPVLVGNAVESYAVCRKGIVVKQQKSPTEQKPDVRQQEFERFSRRYMEEIKQTASIDYRGT